MPSAKKWMLYGSYGYTGELVLERALEAGERPVLAGRDAVRVEEQARRHGLEARPFPLGTPEEVSAQLEGVDAVLNCAGPFLATAGKMVHGCMLRKIHYLDVTGELQVFEALALLDGPAKKQGVCLLPGVGFDVVPTDCQAAHLKRLLPEATTLELGFQMTTVASLEGRGRTPGLRTGISRGTATTMVENLHRGGMVRRNHVLLGVPLASRLRTIDFGNGPRDAVAIPWGDVSTAYHSTGVPNITVYVPVPRMQRYLMILARPFTPFLKAGWIQKALKARIARGPAGPSPEERREGRCLIWGRVEDDKGHARVSRLVTPEGYELTAIAALEAVRRATAGRVPAGFQTPSKAFGPDFILELPGTRRTDDPVG